MSVDKSMLRAHLIGFEFALGLVKINVTHGLDPLDGMEEELAKLKKAIEDEQDSK